MTGVINLDPFPDVSWKRVAFVQRTDRGTLALVKPCPSIPASVAGQVLSWNPPGPGHWEVRDPGSSGPYEQMTVEGGTVAYKPNDAALAVFAYRASVPNE